MYRGLEGRGHRVDDETRTMLRALVALVARQAIPEPELRAVVAPRTDSRKQLKAFNLCDGTKTQTEVAKKAGIDSSNFSKITRRWIQAGVLFSFDVDGETHLLHAYPLT
jgi:hypothetical protein